jgi:signal transduction histidine kinase
VQPAVDHNDEILRLLPHGVVVVSADWRVTLANPEASRLLGATGDTLWARCPELEQTAFASGFRYAMADRTELLTENVLPSVGWLQARVLPTADGGLLISLRQVNPGTLDNGQAKAALLVGELGEALTREESLSAALQRAAIAMTRHLDATIARIWVTDAEGHYLDLYAHAGLDVPDLPARFAMGQHQLGQIAESGAPYLTNDVATDAAVGGSDWMRTERIRSFAGYALRVEDRVLGVMAMYSRRPIDHDTLNCLSTVAYTLALGVARKTADSARRQAETKIRAQAERLEQLHELGKQLSAELDSDALADKVVTTATKLCGATVGAFIPGASIEATLVDDALAGGAFAGASSDAPTAAHVAGRELRAMLPDGPPLASLLATPVLGRKGRVIGALVFGHERPSQFNAESERLVSGIASTAAIAMDNARMFGEARDLITALEKSNAELDQFAYVASHDLKAPLRGIANLSQWIEDDMGDRLDEQTREHLNLMRGRVIRLENLIGGILAYSRAGRERDPKLVSVNMTELAHEVWELLAPPATAKITIGDLPKITGVRVQVQQVLMNLISNALKYNRERDLTIEITVKRDGDRWVFGVLDNGIGIPPEFHERIWGLFQTLERRDKVESTGIGLSVVRKIVESNRGAAWVEARPEGGAAFYFSWPVAEVRHG